MPDLRDGETMEVQGSASRPYVLKNLGGVYSCSCPAWRNQSLPIEKRSCKHLRALRSEAAEELRVGHPLADSIPKKESKPTPPPLLLAEIWNDDLDPTGWLASEKLDGLRAWWDGKVFLSRLGNRFYAPDWFTAGLPLEPLDGELWIARKHFQRTVSIVRRQDQNQFWQEVRFRVFDAPGHDSGFEGRLDVVRLVMEQNRPPFACAHPHWVCQGRTHLVDELARVSALGGEGLMLRQAHSMYESGRSSTLRKLKRFLDGEARVIGHEPGQGRHKGRLGALLVETPNGTRFGVGTGLSDAQRNSPPPLGSIITFSFQELSDSGVPRFPSFVGIRQDLTPLTQGEMTMPKTIEKKKRFEFVDKISQKFWECTVVGKDVHIQFGRIGTIGQAVVKTFASEDAAQKHAAKVTGQKLAKGYMAVS